MADGDCLGRRVKKAPKRFTADFIVDNFDNSDFDVSDDSVSDSDDSFSEAEEDENSRSRADADTDSEDDRNIPGPSTSVQSVKRQKTNNNTPCRPSDTNANNASTSSSRDKDDNDGWVGASEGDKTINPIRFLPLRPPGVNQLLIHPGASELDCLNLFQGDDVIDYLSKSINDYALQQLDRRDISVHSRFAKWVPVTKFEIYKFLSVLLMMGIDPRPSIEDYWSMEPGLYTPFYHEMFSLRRFECLYQSTLHVGDADSTGKNKIEPFFDLLIPKFNAAFSPDKELSIDEMIIGFKGKFKYKQFNGSKPSKYHIKCFGLVDSKSGYVLNFFGYFGSETSYYSPHNDANSSHAIKIFDTLLSVVGTGHHIFADRFYTTRVLVDHLIAGRQLYTGTLQVNRKGFPKDIKTVQLEYMQSRCWITQDQTMIVTSFRDKKAKKNVHLVSSETTVGNVDVGGKLKPVMVDDYNQHMNGCDKADQMIQYYGLQKRRSRKWWKKLFFWVLDICYINAYIIFRKTRTEPLPKRYTQKRFRLNLKSQLSAAAAELDYSDRVRHVFSPTDDNLVAKFSGTHIFRYVNKPRVCKVCKPRRSSYICISCAGQPHLHPKDCFEAYHTKTA